jgi:hypothetical protein
VHAPKVALETLLIHLKAAHAQERLGAITMADVLFQRSHAFRLGFVKRMDMVLIYATGHNPEHPLPPPAKYASKLRRDFISMLTRWHDSFGANHKPLALAVGFIKTKMQPCDQDQDSESEMKRVLNFRRHERAERARKALALFQERLPNITERLRGAEKAMRSLVAFPGDKFWDGTDGRGGSCCATQGTAGEHAPNGGDLTLFRDVINSFDCAETKGEEEEEEEREVGGSAETEVLRGREDGGVCSAACASRPSLPMQSVLQHLGLASKEYTLEVSMGGGLRERVEKMQRAGAHGLADEGLGQSTVALLREACREIQRSDAPALRRWRLAVEAAQSAGVQWTQAELHCVETLAAALTDCERVADKCAQLGVATEEGAASEEEADRAGGASSESDSCMEDVDVFDDGGVHGAERAGVPAHGVTQQRGLDHGQRCDKTAGIESREWLAAGGGEEEDEVVGVSRGGFFEGAKKRGEGRSKSRRSGGTEGQRQKRRKRGGKLEAIAQHGAKQVLSKNERPRTLNPKS